MTRTIPHRSEIAFEHTWDLASVFPSDEAWEAEMDRVAAELSQIGRFRGHLGDSPAILADWLETRAQLQNRVSTIHLYARMSHQVDTAAQAGTAKRDRVVAFQAGALAQMAFAEPEMLAIGLDRLRRWAREEPRLAMYEHYFDQLGRRQEHVRSVEVEELLEQAQNPFSSAVLTHGTLADADLKFRPAGTTTGQSVEVTRGNIAALLTSPDRELRRTAWESYADAFLALKNTLSGFLSTLVKQHIFIARARNYPSALAASLESRHIPLAAFHNLIESYRRHLPTWQRYWRVRRRALGYDTLHVYDDRAPLTTSPPQVPFEQALEWISAGMQPLGDEYVDIMRRGVLEQRWVDRYPNQSKHAGAFSSGAPGTHPFILANYTDDIFSMSTLAHELGHSMHSYYRWKTQPLIYAHSSTFLSEVASNFNQALVRDHLLNSSGDVGFQLAVIEEAMANFYRYFFLMPALARFELEVHERVERGAGLTADGLIRLMADLFREGYGDEVELDPERLGITWAQFPLHLRLNFYVFQYATGIAAAHALAEQVVAGKPGAAENYLLFLKAGNSMYPLDALQLAGVDMRSPEPVEEAFGILARMIDRLERLIEQS